MKAIAVVPGKRDSAHLLEVNKPSAADIAGGRGVLVQMLRAGVCGTDREINNAEYGTAPEGFDHLILGHENLGRVADIGSNVTEFKVGDLVVATVRRPRGQSIYDRIGEQDFTTETEYYEHGISRLHGFMAEFYAEDAEYLVKLPATLGEVGVLLEPLSIIEKGLKQASDIQERLKIWRPKKAAVLGTGSVGLLAVMALRVRGYDVHGFGRDAKDGYLNAELCEAIGAEYFSTAEVSVAEIAGRLGEYDLIFECTGYSPIIFDAMQSLNENGILVLASVTGGGRTVDGVPADKINQLFVLGNRAMVGTVNANREHFEMGVKDLVLSEALYPGWLGKMLTHRVDGLENFARAFEILNDSSKFKAIKIFFDIYGDRN